MDITTPGATSEATPEPQVVFRGKKRKTYRQRTEPADDDESSKPAKAQQPEDNTNGSNGPDKADTNARAQSEDAAEEEKGLSVAEVLRLRNARKARLGGVKFGANANQASGDAAAAPNGSAEALDDLSLMIREEESKALDIAAGVKKRFAPQTGLATELVNKHMEEYIEAELARRHNAAAASSPSSSSLSHGPLSSREKQQQQQQQQSRSTSEPATATTTTAITTTAAPRPEIPSRALQGQLLEIDLGDEARSRNEALTARATRRLQGEAVDEDEDDETQGGRRAKKVRLGRDGKPWRSRNRRNSDDIRRDQLVEEILRESRLDVYETPTPPGASGATTAGAGANPNAGPGGDDDGGAADDRIAEEFRREFMDAMAQRQQKRKKASNAPPGGAGGKGAGSSSAAAASADDVLRGPKLGGSRNVRAAMRNLLLEKAKEAKESKGGRR